MKQIFNNFTSIGFIFLLISIVNAQTQNCDYKSGGNPQECYSQSDFIKNSDATKWDLKYIDWSKPEVYENPTIYNREDIYKNSEVYNNQYFYKNLPNDKYKSVDYRLVNYDLINHDFIDGNKYLRDLGCNECVFATHFEWYVKSDYVKFSSEGIRHKDGDYVSIPGSYPRYTFFDVIEDKILVGFNNLKEQIIVPEHDSLTVSGFDNNLKYGYLFS